MSLILTKLTKENTAAFKTDMRAAFRFGAFAGMGIDEEVLPEKCIDESLSAPGAEAYTAVEDGNVVGGAVIVTHPENAFGKLDFLYVKVGEQGRHIGRFLWEQIEQLHPEVKLWETCTPYFDKRNLHFYINGCGFHAV